MPEIEQGACNGPTPSRDNGQPLRNSLHMRATHPMVEQEVKT
jgi:hypothetical protein